LGAGYKKFQLIEARAQGCVFKLHAKRDKEGSRFKVQGSNGFKVQMGSRFKWVQGLNGFKV
jgi:hypothetical protein